MATRFGYIGGVNNDRLGSPLAIGLRVARAVSGMSIEQLASRAHTRPGTIRKAERGDLPQAPQLVRIAQALSADERPREALDELPV